MPLSSLSPASSRARLAVPSMYLVFGGPMQFIELSQRSTRSTLENRLHLARMLIRKAKSATVLRPKMVRTAHDDGGVTYTRAWDPTPASSLCPAARTFRSVYAEQLKERFFVNDKICDDDLIALKLNWPVDTAKVLGNDTQLIARAERVFARAMNGMERERRGSHNPSPKKKARSRTAHSSRLVNDLLCFSDDNSDDGARAASDGDSPVEEETKTPMGMLDLLRAS